MKDLEHKYKVAVNRVADLTAENERLRARDAQWEVRVKEHLSAGDALVSSLQAENERLRAESDGRHTANLALCAGLKAAEARLAEANAENEWLRAEARDIQLMTRGAVQGLYAERDAAEFRLATANEQIQAADMSLAKMLKDIAALQARLAIAVGLLREWREKKGVTDEWIDDFCERVDDCIASAPSAYHGRIRPELAATAEGKARIEAFLASAQPAPGQDYVRAAIHSACAKLGMSLEAADKLSAQPAAPARAEAESKGPHVLVHKQLLAQLTARAEAEQAVLAELEKVEERSLKLGELGNSARRQLIARAELARREAAK